MEYRAMSKESFPREVRLEQSHKDELAMVGREGREEGPSHCAVLSLSVADATERSRHWRIIPFSGFDS